MEKSKVDEAVIELLTLVRKKKETIKASQTRPQWLTSCTLDIQGGSKSVQDRTNIQTVRDKTKLIQIAAYLARYENEMRQAASLLELEFDSTYMGYPIAHWLTDLKTRVSMLKVEEQKKELDKLNERIDKLVSPEQRREMELVELQKLLQD